MTYIDILFDISNRVGGEKKQEYFVIYHKKHKRTICFRDNKKAIDFIKSKFRHSFFKRRIHSLIKLGFHRWVCDKIILSQKLGDVIFIANSVKSFDLEKEIVFTFKDSKLDLAIDVFSQTFLAGKGFAPEVRCVDEENLYYTEELLYEGDLGLGDISKKLAEFHRFAGYKFIHGDFVRDHVKVDKNGNIKFIDWMIKRGDPTQDVKTFVGAETR
jgi:hypothetical protein